MKPPADLPGAPDEPGASFLSLNLRRDVAELLGVSTAQLNHQLYRIPASTKYQRFEIPKTNGGTRTILSPNPRLKHLQRRLSQVLYAVYKLKASVHGFALGRNVATNAKQHVHARYVLNLDLKDFFPSINFGRVRGLFMAGPYNLGTEAATVLAQLCCHENQLPQGAPTSPIVSNMICSRLDFELQRHAGKHHCRYTRYADDITFSKLRHKLSEELCRTEPSGEVVPGKELRRTRFTLSSPGTSATSTSSRTDVESSSRTRIGSIRRKWARPTWRG